jgi:hypothetical protein
VPLGAGRGDRAVPRAPPEGRAAARRLRPTAAARPEGAAFKGRGELRDQPPPARRTRPHRPPTGGPGRSPPSWDGSGQPRPQRRPVRGYRPLSPGASGLSPALVRDRPLGRDPRGPRLRLRQGGRRPRHHLLHPGCRVPAGLRPDPAALPRSAGGRRRGPCGVRRTRRTEDHHRQGPGGRRPARRRGLRRTAGRQRGQPLPGGRGQQGRDDRVLDDHVHGAGQRPHRRRQEQPQERRAAGPRLRPHRRDRRHRTGRRARRGRRRRGHSASPSPP